MSSSPDHVYLDLSTVNNDILGTDNRPLNFTESRTNPIIDNPSNYYMSVIRFEVDTPAASLPIFIPKLLIDGSNTDKNTTAYSITMARPNLGTGLLDDVVKRYVEWSPQEKIAALPNNQYANTGIPSTTLPDTIFMANDLPYPTSSVILPTLQNDAAKPTYLYTGAPVTQIESNISMDTTQVNFTWVDPQPALLRCSFIVGIFESPPPVFTAVDTDFMQITLFYHIGAGPALTVTLNPTEITQLELPTGVGIVYSYIIVANVEAITEPLGPDVVVDSITISNSSTSQFLGSVPRILSSTYLGESVLNTQPVYNFDLVLDKNYFNLSPTPSSNESLEVLTASMEYSRTYYPSLLPEFLNYSLTDWTLPNSTPVTVLDIATNYTITSAPTCSYTMVLNDSETTPIYLTSNALDTTITLSIAALDPISPSNFNVKFLIGSLMTLSIDGITQITGTVEDAGLDPNFVTLPNGKLAYVLNIITDGLVDITAVQAPLSVCSFNVVPVTVANDDQVILPTPPPPPTNPTVIDANGDILFITDSAVTQATFFGYLLSAFQTVGHNLNIFTLSTTVTLTPTPRFTSSVQYTGIDMSVTPIAPTLSTQDITTGYYNCYNVKWWLNCVNKTLADLWNDIGGIENYAPQMVVDSHSNLITLMTPYNTDAQQDPSNFAVSDNVASTASYLGTGSVPAVNYSMFFNEPMYNLFSSLPSIHYGSTTIGNAQLSAGSRVTVAGNFSIFSYYVQAINYNFKNYIVTNSSLVTEPQHWFLTESEYSPVPMWSPIAALIFSTSLLPVQMSMTTTPNVFGNNIYDKTFAGGSVGNNSQITTMISDIQIGLVTGSEYKPTILYNPRSEYRLIDLLGNTPINQASFSISWKTKFGDVIPFSLGSLCGANLKILFRRRRYNLGNVSPYDTN